MKFRVGVLTILEVDVTTGSWTDAKRVAEGAIEYLLESTTGSGRRAQQVITWRHSNGLDYEATVVRRPIELDAAARNGCFELEVHQPLTREVED